MFKRGKKPEVLGFSFGTVEVIKAGWRKWRAVVKWPETGEIIEEGILSDYSPNDAKTWAENRWKDLDFLTKLQRALNKGQLTPTEYYKILSKHQADREGCKINHTHSMKCKYHQH